MQKHGTMEAMRNGRCHQVYGISDFHQNARLGGLKYHEKYQNAIKENDTVFRRTNGEFTEYQN